MRASAGEWTTRSRPRTAIVPPSGRTAPVRILTSVLLPAPLAPISAWTSPGRTARDAAFRATTPERSRLLEIVGTANHVVRIDAPLAPRAFQAQLRAYRFVLAPPGNGLDTHRFWESLYADAIPIVRRSAWSTALHGDGIPLIEIDEWGELADWTDADLAQRSASLPARPSALPILGLPFWRARLTGLGADAAEPDPS